MLVRTFESGIAFAIVAVAAFSVGCGCGSSHGGAAPAVTITSTAATPAAQPAVNMTQAEREAAIEKRTDKGM